MLERLKKDAIMILLSYFESETAEDQYWDMKKDLPSILINNYSISVIYPFI